MSRNEKIRKLANAVKDFRGMCHGTPEKHGKWVRPPQPTQMARVVVWLERLNLPVQETLHLIRSMKTWQEFNDWTKTL